MVKDIGNPNSQGSHFDTEMAAKSYLDEIQSKPTRNYVMFDDSLIDTKRVNDKLTDSWMNSEARMARADEGGFDLDRRLYHLTPNSFDEFIAGGPDGIDGQQAIFLTPNPLDQSASHNVKHSTSGANIMPVLTKTNSPLYVDEFNREEVMKRWGITNREFPYLVDNKTKST